MPVQNANDRHPFDVDQRDYALYQDTVTNRLYALHKNTLKLFPHDNFLKYISREDKESVDHINMIKDDLNAIDASKHKITVYKSCEDSGKQFLVQTILMSAIVLLATQIFLNPNRFLSQCHRCIYDNRLVSNIMKIVK